MPDEFRHHVIDLQSCEETGDGRVVCDISQTIVGDVDQVAEAHKMVRRHNRHGYDDHAVTTIR